MKDPNPYPTDHAALARYLDACGPAFARDWTRPAVNGRTCARCRFAAVDPVVLGPNVICMEPTRVEAAKKDAGRASGLVGWLLSPKDHTCNRREAKSKGKATCHRCGARYEIADGAPESWVCADCDRKEPQP